MKLSIISTVLLSSLYILSANAEVYHGHNQHQSNINNTNNSSHSNINHNQACKHATKAEIASLFDRWNSSLQTLEPKKVVANYAEDSVLLATVSNKPRLTHEEKEDYFKHFLTKKPVGKIDSRHIKIYCNNAIDTGLYTFTFGDGQEVRAVKARYTYNYHWNGKDWLITSHHSSAMPEKVLHYAQVENNHQ
ncbi:MAG: hypothetical protein RLZZ210_631 [Pseudomonadota bacterium]|jgi:uncharacterized protein (TIGR02246 family)